MASENSSHRERLESLFRDQTTDLFGPVLDGNIDAVKAALKQGAKVDQPNADGERPLLVAARRGHIDIVDVLIKAGAVVDAPNAKGVTPLMVASEELNRELIDRLLAAGASPLAMDSMGATAVDRVVKLAPARERNRPSKTRLQVIAQMAFALARRDDNPDYELQGLPAIHWAATADDADLIEKLLMLGADPFKPAKGGKSFFEAAYQKKQAYGIALRELAIQFRSDFERMRKAGKLNTSNLIDFFDKRKMRSPCGLSYWALSDVQPVYDYLIKGGEKEERVAPELGKRQLDRIGAVMMATINPGLANATRLRAIATNRLEMAKDIAILRILGFKDDAIYPALKNKYADRECGLFSRPEHIRKLLAEHHVGDGSGLEVAHHDALEVLTPVVDSLLEEGHAAGDICQRMVSAKLVAGEGAEAFTHWVETHLPVRETA